MPRVTKETANHLSEIANGKLRLKELTLEEFAENIVTTALKCYFNADNGFTKPYGNETHRAIAKVQDYIRNLSTKTPSPFDQTCVSSGCKNKATLSIDNTPFCNDHYPNIETSRFAEKDWTCDECSDKAASVIDSKILCLKHAKETNKVCGFSGCFRQGYTPSHEWVKSLKETLRSRYGSMLLCATHKIVIEKS